MKAPWHLWVVGLLSLLWNGYGALDYTLTQLDVAAYLDATPSNLRDLAASYPTWMTAVWALAVWLPLLGALLLLGRRRAAAVTYGLALLATFVAATYAIFLSGALFDADTSPIFATLWSIILVIAIVQWLYARAMAKAGVLE